MLNTVYTFLLCDFLEGITSGQSFETVDFLVTWHDRVGWEWHSVVILERNCFFAFQFCVLKCLNDWRSDHFKKRSTIILSQTEGQDEHIALWDRGL